MKKVIVFAVIALCLSCLNSCDKAGDVIDDAVSVNIAGNLQ